jgi:phosphatidate cytidylyltransferase
VSFAALREFLSLVESRRADHRVMVVCFYVLLPLQYWFVLTDWYGSNT